MIFNLIKKLYSARLDEATKALSDNQMAVIPAATAAVAKVSAPETQPLVAEGGTRLLYYIRDERKAGVEGTGPEWDKVREESRIKVTYVANLMAAKGKKKVMENGVWMDDKRKDFTAGGGLNPSWVEILNDFLGVAAKDDEENEDEKAKAAKAGKDLTNAGINLDVVAPQDEDPISRSGTYLDRVGVIEDEKIMQQVTKGIKNIVRSLITRAAIVRSEKGENVDAWAKTEGYAGMRGSGGSNSSWEYTLAHAKGIEWPKDEKGNPARDEKGNLVGPIEALVSEGTLLKATQAKQFFEKLAAGEFEVNQNCARLKKMVSIDESGTKTRISYAKDGEGIVKNAGAPELDAITRIKKRCECDDDNKPGCIDKDKSAFGALGRFAYTPQVVNNYVGKMVESLRVSGLLLRMWSKEQDAAKKDLLFKSAQAVIEEAKSSDDILHKAGLARLEGFKRQGGDVKSLEDIIAIETLEELTNSQRSNLYKIIIKLEAEDLAARDPDIVLPVGLTVGNGDRKDNAEAHLTEEDAIAAMVNQGIDKKKAATYITPTTLDDLVLQGAPEDMIEMYKKIHNIGGDTPIFVMGLSLKNQVHDGSTKFGEQIRSQQSDLFRLDLSTKDGDGGLSVDQVAFRDKAYEEAKITTEAEKRKVRQQQQVYDDIKDTVFGLFPGTDWYMDNDEGKSIKQNPQAIADRIKEKTQLNFHAESPIRAEILELLEDEDTATETGIGRIREKLTRILIAHETHRSCNARHKEGKEKGKLTPGAMIARKHLAATVFFTGGSIDEILASKRGLVSGKVAIYSQNDVIRPVMEGIISGKWEVKAASEGGSTTRIEEPDTGRYVSLSREGSGDNLARDTRYEININSNFLKQHLLKRIKNLFEGNSFDTLLSLMNTQQKLFEKLIMQVQ
jgi:hypothetical protein